jgi:predicted NUDIX family phosphoesterase
MNVSDKMSKYIMCISTPKLFQHYSFEGFSEHSLFDFASHIAQGYEYRMRGPLETDSSYKQTIPYVVVVDQDTQKILAYKRSTQG